MGPSAFSHGSWYWLRPERLGSSCWGLSWNIKEVWGDQPWPESITQFTQSGGLRIRTIHSQILAKWGCISWGQKSLERGPRWDIARGTCLGLAGDRCGLEAVGQQGHILTRHTQCLRPYIQSAPEVSSPQRSLPKESSVHGALRY